jgi:hypothetical protein
MNDQEKLKRLQQFKKSLNKLLDKYPEIMLFGDMNGEVSACTSLSNPNIGNKHGRLPLTCQNKKI